MQFLSANAPIMRIARRFGMNIVIGAGGIADAHLKLPPASPAAIARETVTDIFAVCHRVLKASVAAQSIDMV